MHQTVPERGRFDADTGDRATYGDGLELWHNARCRAMRERRIEQRVVRNHAFHVDQIGRRVDVQDVVQIGGRQTLTLDFAVTKQVRQRLIEGAHGTFMFARAGQGVGERARPARVVRVRVGHPAACSPKSTSGAGSAYRWRRVIG